MFEASLQEIESFVRPVLTISRKFNSIEIEQQSSTIFFINEFGCALTTKKTANKIFPKVPYAENYKSYKSELINSQTDIIDLQNKYGLIPHESIVDLKTIFLDCFHTVGNITTIFHPIYDLALLHFENESDFRYTGYAKFNSDNEKIKKGQDVMILGYPFSGSENYKFDELKDEIDWDYTKPFFADPFPLKSILTRKRVSDNHVSHLEIGCFGYDGHEGSPLFDCNGHIFGMHSLNEEVGPIRNDKTDVMPKFSLSISSSIITHFLNYLGVKFYQIEGDNEVIYNHQGKKPVLPKQLVPFCYMSGGKGSTHLLGVKIQIGENVVFEHSDPLKFTISETDNGSRNGGAVLLEYSTAGDNEIFITEENVGSINQILKSDSYELKVEKKVVSTNEWKLKASVKKQRNTGNEYFDILIIRRHKERNHNKDPHISFYPNASGKYIRYDDEKLINVITKKRISSQHEIILPQVTQIVSDEFEILITYLLEGKILIINDLSIINK